MGLFRFHSPRLTDDDLRDALFNAAAGSSTSALKSLLTNNLERIVALFRSWTTLPPSVQSDPTRMKWWAEGMIGVASAAAALGEGSLMAILEGPPGQNRLVLWQQAFLAAEADAVSGNYSSATRRLEETLENAEGLTGTGVDELLSKTYGLIGTLNYRAGSRDKAHDFTLRAKAYCERIGDHEGVDIYARNLKIIDAV